MPLAQASPRCRAHARSGAQCRQPAVANGCCRVHGGASTGPRTPEGLERLRAPRTIHGWRGAEASQFRQMVRALRAETKRLLAPAGGEIAACGCDLNPTVPLLD
jgi:hypothetical protein